MIDEDVKLRRAARDITGALNLLLASRPSGLRLAGRKGDEPGR
jgi:hypothetical protein